MLDSQQKEIAAQSFSYFLGNYFVGNFNLHLPKNCQGNFYDCWLFIWEILLKKNEKGGLKTLRYY